MTSGIDSESLKKSPRPKFNELIKRFGYQIGFIISGAVFAILMPLGVGPDDNWHITMSYCAYGERDGLCQGNTTPANTGVWSKAYGPLGIDTLGRCFRANYQLNGFCSDPSRAPYGTHFQVNTKSLMFEKTTAINQATYDFENQKLFQTLELNCGNVCKASLNVYSAGGAKVSSISSSIPAQDKIYLTLVPSLNGGSVSMFVNGDGAKGVTLNVPINGAEYAQTWNTNFGKLVSSDVVKVEKPSGFDDIWPAYSFYPSVYYKLHGWMATDNVESSVWKMRAFNLVLLSIILFFAALVMQAQNLRILLQTLAMSGIPMGWFLFGTNNPSLWAWLYSATFIALAWDLTDKAKKNNHRPTFILMIVTLILSSVRSDVIIFNIILLSILLLMKLGQISYKWFTLAFLSCIFAYVTLASDTVSLGGHANLKWIGSSGSFPFHILIEAPAVLMGNFGNRGPLNLWGLSWYDIPIPSIVAVIMAMLLGFIGLFTLLSIPSNLMKVALVLGFILMNLMLIIALITTKENPPGGFIQSRYMLPMFTGILLLALLALVNTGTSSKIYSSIVTTTCVWMAIFTASFVSMLVSVTRFGNGLAVVSEIWLTNFTGNPSFSWVAGDRVLYQLPNLEYFYSPLIQSSALVVVLLTLVSATIATIGKDIFRRIE